MMRSSEVADSRIVASVSCCPASSCVRSSSSSMPRTPFIGVRISWLMVARKADLAEVACSACSLAISIWRSASLRRVMS